MLLVLFFLLLSVISPGKWEYRVPRWQSTQTPTSISSPNPSHQTVTAALPAPPVGWLELEWARVNSRDKVWCPSPTLVLCVLKREAKAAHLLTVSAATAAHMKAATETMAPRVEVGVWIITTRSAPEPSSPPWSFCGPHQQSLKNRMGPTSREWDWTPGSHKRIDGQMEDGDVYLWTVYMPHQLQQPQYPHCIRTDKIHPPPTQ